MNWVERRRLGGGGMMLLGACVGLGLEGVRGVSLIVTGVKRISLLVGELSSELSACEVVVYISGAGVQNLRVPPCQHSLCCPFLQSQDC